MGKAGRVYVEEHYDINRLNDELVEIYQQAVMSHDELCKQLPKASVPSQYISLS
jgi:colanic acid/amylovoran biosynthesis glycosyltransferase